MNLGSWDRQGLARAVTGFSKMCLRFPTLDNRALVRVVAVAAIVAIGTLAHVAYYFPRVVDDLFISLRYAENLALGRGAVYNVGERVEGYSGPLWMLLQSVGFLLRIDGVTWTKLIGLVSLGGVQVGLFLLARRSFGVAGWLAWVPSFFCAANSYVINWTVLGLETPLHLAAIVLCPVAMHAFVRQPSRYHRGWAIACVILLGTTRPESVLYLGVNLLAPFLEIRSRHEIATLVRKLATVVLPAFLALGILLLVRWFYYGHLVANTYFVKGSHVSFDITRLADLYSNGVGPTEAVVWIGGSFLLLVFGWKRKCLAPVLSILACCYFTASVIPDWMPSLRQTLPITVLAPLGWVLVADEVVRRKASIPWAIRTALAAVVVVLLGHAAFHVVRVDNRYSVLENRRRGWVLPKTVDKWNDTLLAYRRVEPPHVTRMGPYDMGQTTQCWGVLETSAEPVEDSWYVGRDIGAVGYYTGVRVFDTAGLFTKTVSMSREWTEERKVSDSAVRAMMALRPLGGEIYDGWEAALGARPELLKGYRIRLGSMRAPYAFLATDRQPPSHDELMRRYRLMQSRLPQFYHLHSLYGVSIGASVDRRVRIVAGEVE